jgi:hypothetical protein
VRLFRHFRSLGLTIASIVLVHGLNGHPERTWRNTQNNFFWPSSLAQQLPKARVMIFGYDTDIAPSLGSNQMRIRGIALDLLNEIRNVRQDDDVGALPMKNFLRYPKNL